ncbi:hypothetical protein MNV49_004878 [Pseudohyphozyma bogoriensis]|nr:hypothetical protein MNV49_004878 [Pseudohyphozyma bogoriensis]
MTFQLSSAQKEQVRPPVVPSCRWPSPAPLAPAHASADARLQFEHDGYLVIPGFFSKQTADTLLKQSRKLLEDFTLEGHPLTQFSTDEDQAIRYFFEQGAFTDGKLNRPKEVAVNKIGHALHELDPEFRKFTLESEDLKNVVKGLQFHKDPRVIQSMVICKSPEIGGAVHSHDDSTFLYTKPLSAIGFWFALEQCTKTNGCLSFLPGSHKTNVINKRLVRIDGGKSGTKIVPIEVEGGKENPNWDAVEGWKEAKCEAGDLVIIHGSVVHRSEKNLSDKSRFIYTFHMIEGEAEWDELNWLQPTPEMPFTKLFP